MNPTSKERLSRQFSSTMRMLVLILATLAVIVAWFFISVGAGDAVVKISDVVPVRVGRTEALMAMILLLLNVLMTYGVFRGFRAEGKPIRRALGTLISSMLALTIWLAVRFLPMAETSAGGSELAGMPNKMNRVEIYLAVILALASALGALLILHRHMKARPVLLMSAYSKKVRCRGSWMSIEEYMEKELGIKISHGMTPEERTEVLDEFRKQSETEEIPHPSDQQLRDTQES